MFSWPGWKNWRLRRETLRELATQRCNARLNEFERLLNEARVALRYEDHDAALDAWNRIRNEYWEEARRSRQILEVTGPLQRFDDAEALMREGLQRSPHDQFFARGLAYVAMGRGDMETAIKRWSDVRERFPGDVGAYVDAVACLQGLKRYDEAEGLMKLAVKNFPDNPSCLIAYARLADERCDWENALTRWRAVLDAMEEPGDALHDWGLRGVAASLIKFEKFDDAEKHLNDLLKVRPADPNIRVQLAQISERRGEWGEAIARWQDVCRRFPANEEARVRIVALCGPPGTGTPPDVPHMH